MLKITIPGRELFNEQTNEFVYEKPQTLQLEHSLVSIAKWESKWEKCFLTNEDKTYEQTLDYIKCMTLTQNVDPKVYSRLTKENYDNIYRYINAKMTATYLNDRKPVPNTKPSNRREKVTAELIYYWMIVLNIPFECQKWHLNRLLTLIRVCNFKNNPPKMSKKALLSRNASLNAARRKKLGTKG